MKDDREKRRIVEHVLRMPHNYQKQLSTVGCMIEDQKGDHDKGGKNRRAVVKEEKPLFGISFINKKNNLN